MEANDLAAIDAPAEIALPKDRLDAGRLYDLVMRLPIIAFNGWLWLVEARLLAATLDAMPRPVEFTPLLITTVAARLSFLVLIALLCVFHLARRRPLAKSRGLTPRLLALLGTTMPVLVVLMPRAAPSVAFNIASATLIMLGNYLAIRALMHLGKSLSIMPEARKLVTDGPYARIRHPLYLAEETAIIGVLLQFMTLPAAALLVAHFLLQLRRMRAEETVLCQAFPEYVSYMRRTWRLVPGVF